MTEDHFGSCPECGKTDGYRNIYRRHFFFCDEHALEQCAVRLSHHLYRGRDLIVGGWLTTAIRPAERNAEVAQPF
jgi:hypothetical protein